MSSEPSNTSDKRKRGNEPRSANSSNARTKKTASEVAPSSSAQMAPELLEKEFSTASAAIFQTSVLVACRAALVKGGAASRRVLAKHRASISSAFARTLEIVGSYQLKVCT